MVDPTASWGWSRQVRDQSTRLGGFSYIPPIIAEARFQASDDLRFEATHMIRRFFSQATMKLLRQAKTNYPMSRPSFHQDKASDNRSYRQADDETSDNGNRAGHGDTTIAQDKENNNADDHAGNSAHQQLTHTTANGRAREKGRAGVLEASRSRRGWNRLRTVAATKQSVLSFIANRSSFLIGELLLGKLSETVVVQGNAPHNCPCGLVCHLIGNRAGFLCTEAPMVRVPETNFLQGITSVIGEMSQAIFRRRRHQPSRPPSASLSQSSLVQSAFFGQGQQGLVYLRQRFVR